VKEIRCAEFDAEARDAYLFFDHGEVAEWLKAAVC
jgi:hypothetical protein